MAPQRGRARLAASSLPAHRRRCRSLRRARSQVDYWGPYSVYWDENEMTLSQNMGQLYLGALPILLILTAGLVRGLLWEREIRVYVVALAVFVLYAFGTYTPAFASDVQRLVPGVSFFRRPVDAHVPDRRHAGDRRRLPGAPLGHGLDPVRIRAPADPRDRLDCRRVRAGAGDGRMGRQAVAGGQACAPGSGLVGRFGAAAGGAGRVAEAGRRAAHRHSGDAAHGRPRLEQRAQRIRRALAGRAIRHPAAPTAATRPSAS